MDNAYDVPDHTDWLNTPLAGYADLENLLHCQICKDFYETPMITSCAHTFCSKCIRTSLSADGKCPLCTKPDQASKLRNNWAVQDIVASFIATRPRALAVARKAQEEDDGARRPGKRKRNTVTDPVHVEEGQSSGRTTRSKTRKLATPQSSQQEVTEIIESDRESDLEPDIAAHDGLVECPLGCGKRMKIEAVDPHLDNCEDEKERDRKSRSRGARNEHSRSSQPPSSHQAKPEERINELHYSGMKDSVLTKKLKDIGIPSWGPKQIMINRHREWVNLWNANCDSDRPRTKRDLLQDLDLWERTQGGRAPIVNGLSKGPMRKDFDGGAHAQRHHDDFSRLIADAKRKKTNPAVSGADSKTAEIKVAETPTNLDRSSEEAPNLRPATTELRFQDHDPTLDSKLVSSPATAQMGTKEMNCGHKQEIETTEGFSDLVNSGTSEHVKEYMKSGSQGPLNMKSEQAPNLKEATAQSDAAFREGSKDICLEPERPLSTQTSPSEKLPMFAI